MRENHMRKLVGKGNFIVVCNFVTFIIILEVKLNFW